MFLVYQRLHRFDFAVDGSRKRFFISQLQKCSKITIKVIFQVLRNWQNVFSFQVMKKVMIERNKYFLFYFYLIELN